jgi:ribosomal protein S18 acetylase RimI-like enzyme
MKRYREIKDTDVAKVIALWAKCGLTRAWNDPVSDIAFARRGPTSTVLVWEINGEIIASVMVGHDGHRGTLYYVGVAPDYRGQGFGKEVVNAAEEWLSEHGVWKANILIRNDNEQARGFYEKLGYSSNAVISLGKRIRR